MTDNLYHKIAKQAYNRFKDVKPKGKAFEERHFEFWVGAYIALLETGHNEAEHVGGFIHLIIATCGWKEVERIAKTEGWDNA